MGKKQTKEDFFDVLYEETYYPLRRFVQRRSKDYAMTDDILQEVYLEVFRHLDDLETHENRVGWIYKTAENKILKLNDIYNQHLIHETNLEDHEDITVAQTIEQVMELKEYRRILQDDEYALLIQKYVEGYSYKEISQINGKSVASNKMKLSRIVYKLRETVKTHSVLLFLSTV